MSWVAAIMGQGTTSSWLFESGILVVAFDGRVVMAKVDRGGGSHARLDVTSVGSPGRSVGLHMSSAAHRAGGRGRSCCEGLGMLLAGSRGHPLPIARRNSIA